MHSRDLIIVDAGPLIKLALADRLDLLLALNSRVYIPDEVYFEAAEKDAWEHGCAPTSDKVRLTKWVAEQKAGGRVFCPVTLVGEAAARKRVSGEYSPALKNHRKNTGALAAHDFLNNREDCSHAGEQDHKRNQLLTVVLDSDGPGADAVKLQNMDAQHLSTFSLLVMLESEKIIASADAVWSEIEGAVPG